MVSNQTISRSFVYRCLVKKELNQVPQLQKNKAQKYKADQPRYLHIGVTYLSKFNGVSALFFLQLDKYINGLIRLFNF